MYWCASPERRSEEIRNRITVSCVRKLRVSSRERGAQFCLVFQSVPFLNPRATSYRGPGITFAKIGGNYDLILL